MPENRTDTKKRRDGEYEAPSQAENKNKNAQKSNNKPEAIPSRDVVQRAICAMTRRGNSGDVAQRMALCDCPNEAGCLATYCRHLGSRGGTR